MNEMYLIKGFGQAYPGFGSDPPTGSDRARGSPQMDPYKCASLAVCERSRTSSSVPTWIKTRAKLNA